MKYFKNNMPISFNGYGYGLFASKYRIPYFNYCGQKTKEKSDPCTCLHNVWFQKISIPPPRKTIGNSEGEGGLKGSNFQGVGGFRGKLLFQRVTNNIQNIESNIRSI